jgi:hypothetical protein
MSFIKMAVKRRRHSGGFSPLVLFAGGEQGAWYEPSPTTCFTDTARTVAAVVGDPVAGMTDLSGRGNHVTQATLANRPILRQSGALYYLENDAVDDFMASGNLNQLTMPHEFWAALQHDTAAGIDEQVFSLAPVSSGPTSSDVQGIFQRSDVVQRLIGAVRLGAGAANRSDHNSAFTVGTPYVVRSVAGSSPNEIRVTSNGNTTTAAATYSGTPGIVSPYVIFGPGLTAEMRFFGGLAIQRALTAGEATALKDYLDARAGI